MASKADTVRDIFDAGGRGLQPQGLRRANERAVLSVVGFNPGVSNADIARLSGLAPQTVSAILSEIDRAGLITRGEVLRGRRGQPATPIFLRAEGAFAIGVEIGWRHIDVLLLDLQAQVVGHEHRDYDFPDAACVLADVAEMTEALASGLSDDGRARLIEMGVAMPSNLAAGLRQIGAPGEQVEMWARLDVVAELTKRTGLEVFLFNDGNAACWAELIAFPRPRPASFIYFMISRFIAAGIVGEGTLWEGATGNSANLGSMLVTDGEGRIRAGHSIASVTALGERLAQAGIAVDLLKVDEWDWASFGPVLDRWIADSARALAKMVYNTTTVIESNLVVVDGIMPAAIRARLVDSLETELHKLPVADYQPPQVLAGHMGRLAPSIGAAELTLYRRYVSRSLVDFAR